MIHLPRNRADAHGIPIPQSTHEIERPVLENALNAMAEFLSQRNEEITVIAVGGAVNTLFHRSRTSTHDVDIFGSNLNNSSRVLLDEVMQYAIRCSSAPLGTDWFNTENQMWLSPSFHRELTAEAMRQNVVVSPTRTQGSGCTMELCFLRQNFQTAHRRDSDPPLRLSRRRSLSPSVHQSLQWL
ncbi:hypothetical protein ACJ73_07715 [Blastomyces percursus]|uniref:Uncharacterized protein n=1 Tax=Blastomyces percursus TaxID=1658174 RepID=A0A1J9QL49_9EURO|nr:hypothetical protein ACJ73_07715 [Blastomyces percursus]